MRIVVVTPFVTMVTYSFRIELQASIYNEMWNIIKTLPCEPILVTQKGKEETVVENYFTLF